MKTRMVLSLVVVWVMLYGGSVWGYMESNINNLFGIGAGSNITSGERNTFLGANAGYSNEEGCFNSFLGDSAGYSNTTGSANIFLGAHAGYSNSTASWNSFLGYGAGYSNTTGYSNSFLGYEAGYSNTTGSYNSFLGAHAGHYNSTGNWNSFLGFEAGNANTTGHSNSFLGHEAGYHNTSGNSNSFLGYRAGTSNTKGDRNSFMGDSAGHSNTTGSYNSFLGAYAGYYNSTGYNNSFLGYTAGHLNSTGKGNVFLGYGAGYSNTTGNDNSFLGTYAGYYNTIGYSNSFLGNNAGHLNSTGSGNVFVGFAAGYNETGSNKLYIANSETTTPLIYGEFDNNFVKINGALVIGGPSAVLPAAGPTSINSPSMNNPGPINPNDLSPKSVRLGSAPLLTVDKVGTLRAGKWCSSPDGVHLTCTQDPPVVEARESMLGETLRNRIATSGVHVLLGGTETGGGWLTSVEGNDIWLSSGAMYEEGAGRWIQESSDGKAVLVGLGEEGYRVFTLTGNGVGEPIRESEAKLHIDYSGNVGLGVTPQHALHMAGGAYTDGGSWINGSSREYKEEIEVLSGEEALIAINELNPVKYAYKVDRGQKRVGFIAEDVPELVATKDRKGLSSMDIVAVLTKVVQEQQKMIEEQKIEYQKTISTLREELNELKGEVRRSK